MISTVSIFVADDVVVLVDYDSSSQYYMKNRLSMGSFLILKDEVFPWRLTPSVPQHRSKNI